MHSSLLWPVQFVFAEFLDEVRVIPEVQRIVINMSDALVHILKKSNGE